MPTNTAMNTESVTPTTPAFIKASEAMRMLGVSIHTMEAMERDGTLVPIRLAWTTKRRGWRRYRLSDIQRLMASPPSSFMNAG